MNWRYRHTLVVAAFLACVSNNAARLVVSPVIPNLMGEFAVSKSDIGLALTGMWAVYALLQFPSGLLADRFGEYRVITAALALTALGSVLIASAPSFALFALFAVVLGGGAGLYFTVGTSLLSKEFRRRGVVLGIHSAGGPTAGLVAPVAAASIAVAYGWRPALLVGAALSLLALAAFVLRVRPTGRDAPARDSVVSADSDGDGFGGGESPVDGEGAADGGHRADGPVNRPDANASGDGVDVGGDRPPSVVETVAGFLRRPPVVGMTLLGVVLSYTWQSFTSFFPTFLVEYRGLSVQEASLAFGAVFLLSAVSQPAWGRLSDRVPGDAVLALLASGIVAGFSLVLFGGRTATTLLGIGLLGAGMSWGGVFQSRFMDLFSDAERGSAFGLVRTVYMFLGAAGSVVTGTLADVAGWGAAYGVVAGLLALAVVAISAGRIRSALV